MCYWAKGDFWSHNWREEKEKQKKQKQKDKEDKFKTYTDGQNYRAM